MFVDRLRPDYWYSGRAVSLYLSQKSEIEQGSAQNGVDPPANIQFHFQSSFTQRCYVQNNLPCGLAFFSFVNQVLPQQKVFAVPDHELPQDAPDQPENLTLSIAK